MINARQFQHAMSAFMGAQVNATVEAAKSFRELYGNHDTQYCTVIRIEFQRGAPLYVSTTCYTANGEWVDGSSRVGTFATREMNYWTALVCRAHKCILGG